MYSNLALMFSASLATNNKFYKELIHIISNLNDNNGGVGYVIFGGR